MAVLRAIAAVTTWAATFLLQRQRDQDLTSVLCSNVCPNNDTFFQCNASTKAQCL